MKLPKSWNWWISVSSGDPIPSTPFFSLSLLLSQRLLPTLNSWLFMFMWPFNSFSWWRILHAIFLWPFTWKSWFTLLTFCRAESQQGLRSRLGRWRREGMRGREQDISVDGRDQLSYITSLPLTKAILEKQFCCSSLFIYFNVRRSAYQTLCHSSFQIWCFPSENALAQAERLLYAGLTKKTYGWCCREARSEALGGDYQFRQPKAPGKAVILLDVLNTLPKPDLVVLLTHRCTLLLPKQVFAGFLEFRWVFL